MSEIHVFSNDGEWEVWLDPDGIKFNGLCVGVSDTRDEAVADAVKELEAMVARLKAPPA